MKNRIRNTFLTTAVAVSAIAMNTVPVFAEEKNVSSLKTGNAVAKTTQEEQDAIDQEFENYCSSALASMNLDGKSWKEKADAITDYVAYNFGYDANYTSAYSMFKHGGGDCWASTSMIVSLGKRAGFAATARYANIDGGAGNGHENALLQDPDGNVYLCEAGYVRDVHTDHESAVQIGSADQLAYEDQPYQIYTFTDDTKSALNHDGPYFDPHIVSIIYNFDNKVIQIPTDDSINTLGFDAERVAADNNADPDKPQIQKDDSGRWMVDATIGDDGWFEHQFYYDPFMLCDNLETVKVGKNITKISETALSGTYEDEKRSFKFEIDPANPVYANTADGGLMLKVNNDQGNTGDVIYTPTTESDTQNNDNTGDTVTDQNADPVNPSADTSSDVPSVDYMEESGTADTTAPEVTSQPAVSDEQKEETVTMYRAYNPNSGEHFYTGNTKEFNYLVSLGWRNEGTGWIAPKNSSTPVYRLYNKNGGEHHYTMSAKEKNALVKAGWKDEGIGWYSDDQQRTPLYRQYNPNAFANNHNYTTAAKEKNYLISIGWRDEGIGWYGVSAE